MALTADKCALIFVGEGTREICAIILVGATRYFNYAGSAPPPRRMCALAAIGALNVGFFLTGHVLPRASCGRGETARSGFARAASPARRFSCRTAGPARAVLSGYVERGDTHAGRGDRRDRGSAVFADQENPRTCEPRNRTLIRRR